MGVLRPIFPEIFIYSKIETKKVNTNNGRAVWARVGWRREEPTEDFTVLKNQIQYRVDKYSLNITSNISHN